MKRDLPVFDLCGCCDHWHRPEFRGDCRNDAERFSTSDLEDSYGFDGWRIGNPIEAAEFA